MKNLLLSTCILFIGFVMCNAQAPIQSTETNHGYKIIPEDRQPALYPGGDVAMFKFIKDNVQYPTDAKEAGIQGKVYLSFTIDSIGYVRDVKVLRGLSESIDAEAVRLINAMPKWKPAMENNKAVHVRYNFPLEFKLN